MSGIKGRPLKVLQSLYSDIRQSVLVDGQQTEYIRAHQGVRQGCPMSPVLFSIFIEQLVRRLKQASVGIKLDTQLMFALYADDAVPRPQPQKHLSPTTSSNIFMARPQCAVRKCTTLSVWPQRGQSLSSPPM